MPQLDHLDNSESLRQAQLKEVLRQLNEKSKTHLSEKYGLSSDFRQQKRSETEALRLCEKAMQALETDYIEHFTRFQESQEPKIIMQSLEQAEVVWQAEAMLISALDREGDEQRFLAKMRQHALNVMDQKLEFAGKLCARDNSDENIAMLMAVAAVTEGILAELAMPESVYQRRRLRKIIKEFA